jgi:ligand-binding SRPBCC domain-containing protein
MVDAAIQGPFPCFRHRHSFEVEGNSTWIKDTIDFDPPWGKAGWFLLPGILAVLGLMFFYRGLQTRRLLEK